MEGKKFIVIDNDNPSRNIEVIAEDINEAKSKGASELKTTNIRLIKKLKN